MANALYRRFPNGEWMKQDGGGPVYLTVARDADGNWYPEFTYNGTDYVKFIPAAPFTTQAAAQAALDTYMGNMNTGTA
jgi:hypothetical protein